MYTSSTPAARPSQRLAGAYTDVGVQGAAASDSSGHALIGMLFDGALAAIARARGALQAGDVPAKSRAIAQALAIVSEGLRSSLNIGAGGALASDLDNLYAYLELRLTHANLRNDDDALAECSDLLRPLQDAWTRIAPQVRRPG